MFEHRRDKRRGNLDAHFPGSWIFEQSNCRKGLRGSNGRLGIDCESDHSSGTAVFMLQCKFVSFLNFYLLLRIFMGFMEACVDVCKIKVLFVVTIGQETFLLKIKVQLTR